MRKKIVLMIAKFIQLINRWLIKIHMIRPRIIVLVDGGICSQMRQYLCGQYYAEVGIKVYYDLYWFSVDGKDTNGKYERPFELNMMYPNLQLSNATRLSAWLYRHFMKPFGAMTYMPDRGEVQQSYYLTYMDFRDDNWFSNAVKRFLPTQNAIVPVTIIPISNDAHNCAVHIRRGDMSYVQFEGYERSIDYFISAMRYVRTKYEDVIFFLFSDEPEWVKNEVFPLLPEMKVEIITGNMGHVDLLLAAQCETIIASQGTMGRMAGLLNDNAELIIPPTGDWGAFHVERYRDVKVLYAIERS